MLDLKRAATDIFRKTLEALDIESRLRAALQVKDEKLILNEETINLSNYREIVLIGMGKASLEMGRVVEAILDRRVRRGILVGNQKSRYSLTSEVLLAGHPTPNDRSLTAAKKILELLGSLERETLVIFLISGGGSSLVELPIEGISLDNLRQLNRALVNSGATIAEINRVRKALSQIKGGKLAGFLRGNRALAIYLSDVNPGDLGAIASGPLWEADEPSAKVQAVIERYHLRDQLPSDVTTILETPSSSAGQSSAAKSESAKITHLLLQDNDDAVRIAAAMARQAGFQVAISPGAVEGDYREIADSLLAQLQTWHRRFPAATVCIVSGGEASCQVKGQGIGGRNLEFVLYSATKLAEQFADCEAAVLSCGTDGIDGISTASGAVADCHTVNLARGTGMDADAYIERNDSYSFLQQTGGLLLTGPSGNNVRDLRVLLARTTSI